MHHVGEPLCTVSWIWIRERKDWSRNPHPSLREGLVTLQLLSCCHGRNLMWLIRTALFVDRIHCHGVQLHHVFTRCQHLITIIINLTKWSIQGYFITYNFINSNNVPLVDNCVPRQQLGVTRPFLSLWRVWLARLRKYLASFPKGGRTQLNFTSWLPYLNRAPLLFINHLW